MSVCFMKLYHIVLFLHLYSFYEKRVERTFTVSVIFLMILKLLRINYCTKL